MSTSDYRQRAINNLSSVIERTNGQQLTIDDETEIALIISDIIAATKEELALMTCKLIELPENTKVEWIESTTPELPSTLKPVEAFTYHLTKVLQSDDFGSLTLFDIESYVMLALKNSNLKLTHSIPKQD